MDNQNIYFAAREAKDTAAALMDKSNSFFNYLRMNTYLEKLQKMWRAYHGSYTDGFTSDHQINFTGEQGELVTLPVNHFRNIAQHILVMVTSSRPVMDARAINTDYKSLSQAYLANGILEYYMRERGLEDYLKKAVEYAIILGAGFIKMEWNATSGEAFDVDPDTGEFAYEGDLQFSNLSPFDVVVDGTRESWDNDWIMTRTFKNRYDLIAKYPEHEDRIIGLASKNDNSYYKLAMFSNDNTDDIPVYEFFHKRTESMPDGRYLLFLDSDIILLDTKMPYRDIPVYRISPSDILGTPYGYSPMFDIFPIQEGINSLYSTIMTNQNAFGVQNVFVPRGADINVSTISGEMNIIEGNAKPEPLNLTNTPKEVFDFLKMLIETTETLSGVNSVARGNPEASLKSGTALALVQSQALQFMSGLQSSYVKLIENTGTSLITILKDFANTPRIVAIVGKNNRPLLKEFTGEQLSAINRVVVDMGNPLARTISGRASMAEQMLQMGLIKNPQQYFQVINTGRLDSTFEGEMSELLLIKMENEKMMEGSVVQATILDDHKLHITEHKAVINDPDLRQNPELVQNVLAHVQEHIDALRNTDPDLLVLLNQQPLQPQAALPLKDEDAGQAMAASNMVPGNSAAPMNMAPPLPVPGDQVQGPGVESVKLPNLPKVDPSLLPNPELQEASMGNLRQ